MSASDLRVVDATMTPERLQSYVVGLLRIQKSQQEIEEELLALGIDRETSAAMVRNALDDQWHHDGGGGPAHRQVGPRHMIAGLLLILLGGGASLASYYAVFDLGTNTAYLFYGAIVAGLIDFLYGAMRFIDG